MSVGDDDLRAFVVKTAQRLRLKLTPRLIEDAMGDEHFTGNDFMPLDEAPGYYGVTKRQVWTWLKRGVVAGFRFSVPGLEYGGAHIRARSFWMVRRDDSLRQGVMQETVWELVREQGWGIGARLTPTVHRRTVQAWAHGRTVKRPEHRQQLLRMAREQDRDAA